MERVGRTAALPTESSSTRSTPVEELFEGHYLQFVRLAWLLVDDRETAEDVVQEAFLKCQRRWYSIENPDRIVGYVRAAVLNGSRSKLRQRKTRRSAKADLDRPLVVPDTADLIVNREECRRVMTAIRRLPTRQREVVLLRYFEDLSIPEMAAVLRISSGAVKGSLFRATGSLRAMLEG